MNELDYVMNLRARMRRKLFRILSKRGRLSGKKALKEWDSAWKERTRMDKNVLAH